MLLELTSTAAIVAYLATAFFNWKAFFSPAAAHYNPWPIAILGTLAALLHVLGLAQQLYGDGGLNLGLTYAFSLLSWLVSIQILIASVYHPVQNLGLMMWPISALAVLLAQLFPGQLMLQASETFFLQAHVMLSIIAYSLISMGMLQAIVVSVQNRSLHNHHPGGFIRLLPPLAAMESLLFQFLSFGFAFLSLALFSGFLFLDDLFAQHLVHKTVLSIAGWFILAALLFGRWRYGWRGKTAIRWTFSGFAFLMLAYFGSKLVLEIILG